MKEKLPDKIFDRIADHLAVVAKKLSADADFYEFAKEHNLPNMDIFLWKSQAEDLFLAKELASQLDERATFDQYQGPNYVIHKDGTGNFDVWIEGKRVRVWESRS